MTPQWLLNQELEDTLASARPRPAPKPPKVNSTRPIPEPPRGIFQGRCALCGKPARHTYCHACSWAEGQ